MLERFQKKKSFLKLSVRKDVVNKSILYQFYRCGVHKRCSGIRAKFEKGQQIEIQTCAYQQTDIAEDYAGIELNVHTFKIIWKNFFILEKQ